MMCLIGLIIVIVVSAIVKIFDSKIRPYHYAKMAVNFSMFMGLLLFVAGLVKIIIS